MKDWIMRFRVGDLIKGNSTTNKNIIGVITKIDYYYNEGQIDDFDNIYVILLKRGRAYQLEVLRNDLYADYEIL